MTIRGEFEAWVTANTGYKLHRFDALDMPWHGEYKVQAVDSMWRAWQAAYSTALEAAAQACGRRVADLDYSSREYTRQADAIECARAIRAMRDGT